MPSIEPLESSSPQPISNNWYLLTVRSKKREVFLKYLKFMIDQNKLEELVLDIKIPQESVYEDMVLLNLSNFKNASTYLKKVECFQNIERKPLQSEQVNRMLGIG
ncbi:chromosome segregation ATPase [Trichormus sp. NMC-1]|uniref:chromosome segregation ATPase n=1 Tax=Trichormus sp. NMC-1 TaxID=1853259 RepID=UPI0008DC2AAC|nr:chromosome segregation ATPase [Trichormus sp. NMC-1]